MAEYIEREKLIEHLQKDQLFELVEQYGITGVIESIPAADVRPVVRGKWIIDRAFGNDVMSNEQMVICSVCGKGIFWGKQNYCPNCGADMRIFSTNCKNTVTTGEDREISNLRAMSKGVKREE